MIKINYTVPQLYVNLQPYQLKDNIPVTHLRDKKMRKVEPLERKAPGKIVGQYLDIRI